MPFYAILRAVPDKLGGVILMFSAIFVMFLLPWLDTSKVRSGRYRPLFRQFYALFVVDCLLLGYLGAMPAEGIYIVLARIGTVYYFAHFLIVLPMLGIIERPKDVPESISSPVLSGAAQPAE